MGIEFYYKYWVKEKGSEVYCPYENKIPIVELARMGRPLRGEIVGEFQMYINRFNVNLYPDIKEERVR